MAESNLFMVQGLYLTDAGKSSASLSSVFEGRSEAVAERGDDLGVRSYEQIDGGNRVMANRFLRLARGTAPAVDAVEIFEVDGKVMRRSLTRQSGREGWEKMAGCTPYGFDVRASFLLIGSLRLLVDGPVTGQRVLWFGRGLHRLSEDEFVTHYTGHHGPLVAANAVVMGIRSYRQVANDQNALCDSLRGSLLKLGLGQASPPPVFAEMAMATPPLNLDSLRARRLATRAIKADEKRHIDFHRSMLLLV